MGYGVAIPCPVDERSRFFAGRPGRRRLFLKLDNLKNVGNTLSSSNEDNSSVLLRVRFSVFPLEILHPQLFNVIIFLPIQQGCNLVLSEENRLVSSLKLGQAPSR